MSGETEGDVSAFTVDSLHAHLSRRINDLEKLLDERADRQDKATALALTSAEKAVVKAETASEKRFDSVNEFRQTLSDQAALFLTRTEYNAAHEALEKQVTELTNRVTRAEGRTSGSTATFGVLLAVATIVISIVVVFINVLTKN